MRILWGKISLGNWNALEYQCFDSVVLSNTNHDSDIWTCLWHPENVKNGTDAPFFMNCY